jgi:adenylate kinase family enzyme
MGAPDSGSHDGADLRIAIIGSGGAGKSTFARTLAKKLNIPVVHLDAMFWHPGWVEMPQDEWRSRQEELVRESSWIIDGTHAPTLDVRLRAANTVVILDLNRYLCTWRIVKRRVRYRRRARSDRAPGCHEHLNATYVRWVWRYRSRSRPEALAAIAEHAPHAEVVRLTTRGAVKRFLAHPELQGPTEPRAEELLSEV